MNLRSLDKSSHVPLYLQLTEQLVRLIDAGVLKPGDKIESERDISEYLKVSRITARLAIQELLKGGLIYREQGRGTFVAESKITNVQGFTSFTENMTRLGVKPGATILQQSVIPADEALAQTLHIQPGEPMLHLVRLRTADERPVAIQTTYLPLNICQGLEKEDLTNKSLFSELRQTYNIYPVWTEAVVEASAAQPDEAHLLGLKAGEPVLIVRGITFSDSFEIVESVKTMYPSRGFSLYIGRQRI